MSYVVVGHYCPTDATPFEDSELEKTAVIAETRDEAEGVLLWFPGGEIVPVRGTAPQSLDHASSGYDTPNDPEPGDSE